MSLTVEDGTGLEDADSYVDQTDFETYCENLNVILTDFSDEKIEAALRKGTSFVDGYYRGQWPGTKVNGRDQALEWPREDAIDAGGHDIDDESVPREVIKATNEAAIRELQTPGVLSPDVKLGAQIASQEVGPVSRSFFQADSTDDFRTEFTEIEQILSGLIRNLGSSSSFLLRG